MSSWIQQITHPTLLIDEAKAHANLERMATKAAQLHCVFRPHVKTHQSIEIARWYRDYDIRRIAVSSVRMAAYFAADGWDDILIAFPLNPLEWPVIRELSQRVTIGVTVSNLSAARWLQQHADSSVQVWIELEAGQQRTGFTRGQQESLPEACRLLLQNPHCVPAGILIHAGSTYQVRGKDQVTETAMAALHSMQQVMHHIPEPFRQQVSFGDTPSAMLANHFPGVTELRPGNFIFFDLMQSQIGSCTAADIALAVACPVVDSHFLYGGAVHLSKDGILQGGRMVYGAVAEATAAGWDTTSLPDMPILTGLSQEHGWVDKQARALRPGTIVPVLPVHSCLAAECLPYYLTTTGRRINKLDVRSL